MGLLDRTAAGLRSLADKLGKPSFAGTPFPTGRTDTPEQLTAEQGGTGTFNFGGFIRGEDPNPELDAQTAVKNYDQMRRSDSQVHAALEVVKQPIRTADYEVDPSDPEDPEAIAIAEFVEWNLFKGMTTTWDDFIRQSLLMLDFGFMLFEKVWTVEEEGQYAGRITLHKLAARPPRTIWQWFTDEDGALISIKQLAVKAGTYQFLDVPSSKLVRFTYQQEGDNFTGISMLRSAYPHWLIKKQLYLIDAIRATRFGVGIPRAKLKAGYKPTTEDRAAIALMLQGLSSHQHAYLIEPEQMEVDILMPQGVRGGAELMSSINHQNEQITRNILAQFLDMGGKSQGGSRALGASAMDFFLNAIESIANQLCDVINKQVIKDLVDMNFAVPKYPIVRPVGIHETDVKDLAAAAQSLAGAGLLTPDRKTENTFRTLLNLPEIADEQGTLPGGSTQPPTDPTMMAPDGSLAPTDPTAGAAPAPAAPAAPAAVPANTTVLQPTAAQSAHVGPSTAASAVMAPTPATTTVTAPAMAIKAPNAQRAEKTGADQEKPVVWDPPAPQQLGPPAATNGMSPYDDAYVAPQQPELNTPVDGVAGRPAEPDPAANQAPTGHDPRGQAPVAPDTWSPMPARPDAYGAAPRLTTPEAPAKSDVRPPPSDAPLSNNLPPTAHMARSSVPSSGDADEEGHSWAAADVLPSGAASPRPEVGSRSMRSPTAPDGVLWRQPTSLELRVLELREIPRRLDTARTGLLATLRSVREEQISRIASAVAHGKPGEPVKAPLVGKMTAEIERVMHDVFEYGHDQVFAELRKQGLTHALSEPALALAAPKDRKKALPHLTASAQLSAQTAAEKLLATARAEALRLSRAGWDEDEIEDALKIHMGELSDADIKRVANTEVNEGFSMGRVAAAEELKDRIERVVYSAILDNNVCQVCEDLDGEEFDIDSDEYEEHMPPNPNCEGGDQCRCAYIYTLKEEANEETELSEAALADWDEDKHARDDRGRFSTSLTAAPAGARAWSGAQVALKTELSKSDTGKLGEQVAAAYLNRQLKVDVQPMNDAHNNFPLDLVAGQYAVEVKAGLASNSDRATQWRLTIGEPGDAEKAWLARASARQVAKWGEAKSAAILDRKALAIKNVSKELGRRLEAKTVTVIINPDKRLVDVFEFTGFHERIGWRSEEAKKAYRGTFRYRS